MTSLLVGLVLTAALLHAVWNGMAKSGGHPEYSIAAYQLTGSVICIGLSTLIPIPARESWPIIFLSVIIHNLYFFSLARAYRAGDLSQVYPLFRGLAPVLVAFGAIIFADEWLSPGTLTGIIIISGGVISLAFKKNTVGAMPRKALFWGLTTSFLIACYTVTDGIGVRTAGNSISYILWLFIFEVVPIGLILLLTRRWAWIKYMGERPIMLLAGGVASSTAYGLVIFAMGLGAMAVVSSLRETSVIFAALIGSIFLHEPFGSARIRAAALVAGGIILMRVIG